MNSTAAIGLPSSFSRPISLSCASGSRMSLRLPASPLISDSSPSASTSTSASSAIRTASASCSSEISWIPQPCAAVTSSGDSLVACIAAASLTAVSLEPCHDQKPRISPLSAKGPISATFCFLPSGRTPLFFRSTQDSSARRRDTSICSSQQMMASSFAGSAPR
ncbi:hypothetical protein D3C71_1368730 [compost metagenome]